MLDTDFYQGKKVFITGHTGFVGSWLCHTLVEMGAEVSGYALDPPTTPNLYEISEISKHIDSTFGDIRNYEHLKNSLESISPDVVFHLAAQPIVRDSYINPRYTYETNVLGTVNILECVRTLNKQPLSLLNVTTDKVYLNNEFQRGIREDEPLDGFEPYSNSKSCSELVTHCYKNSYFYQTGIVVSTARAGNVIGGGDFANDRIIPDCVRAALKEEAIIVRNPQSIRPYQHVLESIYAYLMIAEKQYKNIRYSGYYNVGPNEQDCLTTGEIAELFCKNWGNGLVWLNEIVDDSLHEANILKLDCNKLKNTFGWEPHWNTQKAIEKTVEWTKAYIANDDISGLMKRQFHEFLHSQENDLCLKI